MSNPKRPELKLEGNISENFKNFELRFNDFCIQADYRDLDKDPSAPEHYKKATLELAALRSALPDDALQVVRYTIEPQISQADKKKPWVWMEKLRTHYTGSVGSSLMSERYRFWNIEQSAQESVQDWEVKVRQQGSLCEYAALHDEMCRDKFVFGLHSESIRTELLKTHLKSNGSAKSMNDVVSEAKAYESAVNANRMIEQRLKTDEQVNWTGQRKQRISQRKPHKMMKLRRQPGTCHWCGDKQGPHPWRNCPANGKKCNKCNGYDHFASVCLENETHHVTTPSSASRKKFHHKPRSVNAVDDATYDSYSDPSEYEDDTAYSLDPLANITPARKSRGQKYFAILSLSSDGSSYASVRMQIDTAATCNTISHSTLRKIPGNPKLVKSQLSLHPYGNGKPIKPLGEVQLICERDSQFHLLLFQVISDDIMQGKPALISGTDSVKLGLVTVDADEIFQISPPLICNHIQDGQVNDNPREVCKPKPKPSRPVSIPGSRNLPKAGKLTKAAVLKQYDEVFNGLGHLGPPVSFKIDPNVTPVSMPVHRIPVAKRAKEKETLDRYVKAGILAKVTEPTPWCSNTLIRETPKKFRICIDPSQTINKAILRPVFQLPTLNEQLHRLYNAKCFSLVDAKEGFLQVPLDEHSSKMTTMHTSLGRYRWLRLPFGISSAPEEFQSRLLSALDGLDGIICIADDILVFGEGNTSEQAEIDHDRRLVALMERCTEKQIKLNPEKFRFKVREVKFMGHVISDKGMKPDPEKVEAVTHLPRPKDKTALLRLIGMLNYLSPFCQNLSAVIQPLRALTKEGVEYVWSEIQDKAFNEAKHLVSTAPTLMYYDINKPVTLQVDASEGGLGGALLQPNKDNKLQPVAFTSCSMSETEQRYSQIEKECLAICNGFQKFDQWLYGKRDIEVHTDHKPLESIMKKPLNKAPTRLQKMLMRLQRYHFTVTYKPGPTMYLADTLSRAALKKPPSAKVTGFEVFRLMVENPPENTRLTTPTQELLKQETKLDRSLSRLYSVIVAGWPSEKQLLPDCLHPYWTYRDELSVQDGIIYKGCQVLVPQKLIPYMLKRIHSNHMGAESNIRMAREVMYWPGMRAAIHDMCSACSVCAQYSVTLPKEPMRSLPIPASPWQLISQDIFSLDDKSYLITVCHYSDWTEVDELPDTLASTVIQKTKAHFARYGIPSQCHTDNGPQFISKEYQTFAKSYGFLHSTSSPYHSQGNGKAESAVKICKSLLRKSDDFHAALLTYRNTPPSGHTFSPAQRMFHRRTRTTVTTSDAALMPSLVPSSVVKQEIARKRDTAKQQYDRHCSKEHDTISVGDYVYAKPPPARKGQPWIYGKVQAKPAPRSYTIDTNNGLIRRNRVQLHIAQPPRSEPLVQLPETPEIPNQSVNITAPPNSTESLSTPETIDPMSTTHSTGPTTEIPETSVSSEIPAASPRPSPFRRTRTRIIRPPVRYTDSIYRK